MWVRVQHFLELIRFSHTIFALPFAMLSAVIAWSQADSVFRWQDLAGILICMVTARSAAMAFNRLVDRDIDKRLLLFFFPSKAAARVFNEGTFPGPSDS